MHYVTAVGCSDWLPSLRRTQNIELVCICLRTLAECQNGAYVVLRYLRSSLWRYLKCTRYVAERCVASRCVTEFPRWHGTFIVNVKIACVTIRYVALRYWLVETTV